MYMTAARASGVVAREPSARARALSLSQLSKGKPAPVSRTTATDEKKIRKIESQFFLKEKKTVFMFWIVLLY
jgi:hypothetical protein